MTEYKNFAMDGCQFQRPFAPEEMKGRKPSKFSGLGPESFSHGSQSYTCTSVKTVMMNC